MPTFSREELEAPLAEYARSLDPKATGPEVIARALFRDPFIGVVRTGHPRLDTDPAHRWLRGLVLDICTAIR